MEFIKAEEFLGQPVEVQQTLVNWANLNVTDYDLVQMNGKVMLYIDFKNREDEFLNCDSLPIFTEGQLRRFIEDKTGYKIDSLYFDDGYTFGLTDGEHIRHKREWGFLETDMLQAYWKVAIEIAKEAKG